MAIEQSPLERQIEEAKKKSNAPVNVKDVTGQLTAFQPGQLGQAVQAQGVQTPTTPVSVAGTGMGPDSAKMAGTPNQLQGAQQRDTLSTAQRQQQGRTEMTPEEQAKREKSANLQSLGTLGDRVQGLINTNLNAIQPVTGLAAAEGTQGDTTAIATAIQGSDPAAVQTALANYFNAEKTAGRTPDVTKITGLFKDPAEAVAAVVSAGLMNDVKASDIVGLDNELSNAGIQFGPEDTLASVQTKIKQAVETEFQEGERLKGVAFSPSASPAERAAARQALMDMGSLQLSATEESAHKVEQAVAEADDVEFGGKSYKMTDLLNDTTMSGLIVSALKDPNTLAKLKETNPQLASFIETQRTNLQGFADELAPAQQQFTETQDKNANLDKTDFGNLDATAMSVLYPGWTPDGFVAAVPEMAAGGVSSFIKNAQMDPSLKSSLLSTVNTLSRYNPNLVAGFNKLNEGQLKSLLTPNSKENSMLQGYLKALENPSDPYLKYAFSGITDKNMAKLMDPAFQTKYTDALTMQIFGTAPNAATADQLTVMRDPDIQDLLQDGKFDKTDIQQLSLDNNLEDLISLTKLPLSGKVKTELESAITEQKTRYTNEAMNKYGAFKNLDLYLNNLNDPNNRAILTSFRDNIIPDLLKDPYVDQDLVNEILDRINGGMPSAATKTSSTPHKKYVETSRGRRVVNTPTPAPVAAPPPPEPVVTKKKTSTSGRRGVEK
jgi:hypothetical protein